MTGMVNQPGDIDGPSPTDTEYERWMAARRWWEQLARNRHQSIEHERTFAVWQAQEILNKHGFAAGPVDGIPGRKTSAAIQRFQTAYAGGTRGRPFLAVDGILGPLTSKALEDPPHLSPHFTAREFASKGNGNCFVHRELLVALEHLRSKIAAPIAIVSGYRDPRHNRRVGGATRSLHMAGAAADISRTLNIDRDWLIRKELFSGIGYLQKSHRVTHVDVRHAIGRGKSVANPQTWKYRE